MNKSKWGVLGIISVVFAVVSGSMTVFFSVASVVSLKKYCRISSRNQKETL